MKKKFGSRSRTLLPLAVALSLVTSLFSFAPTALAGNAPATISGINPASGTTAGGTSVTISGTNFITPGTNVHFDGNLITPTSLSDTSITLTTPAHAAGTVAILVHTDFLPDVSVNYTYVTPFHVTYLNTGSTSGTPPSDPTPYMSGDLVTVLGGGTLVKTGYSFGGWQDCLTNHVYGITFTITGNTDMCPLWTPNTFTVTYDGNTNTSGVAPIDSTAYPSGATVVVAASNTLVKTGYTFGGWANGMFGSFQPGQTFAIPGNITFAAVWNLNSTYSVTYLGNGNSAGTVPIDSTAYSSGNTVTVLGQNTLVKTGYTFGGWNSGGGIGPSATYQLGQTFAIASNTTLTAIWNLNSTYSVTYLGNGNSGGTVPIDSTAYSSGNTVTVLGQNTLVKTGYTFGGWANGGLAIYQPGQTFTISGNTTLTAVWTANGTSFTITYLGNGNTTGVVPSPTTGSGMVNLATNSGLLVKTGSTFGGWNTAATGLGTTYAVGSSYNLIANVTLYAIWITGGGITYTITYVGNGNTTGYAPVPTIGSGSVTLATNSGPMIKTGYTFSGWNTAITGLGTSYAGGVNYNLIADVVLYAKWTPVGGGKFIITYDGNGNTSGIAPPPTVGSGSVSLAHNLGGFVKAGSAFGGWNSNTGGTGTSFAVGANYNLVADVTLYAAWTVNAIYTITYSGNGDTGGTVPTSVTGSGSVTLATNSGGLVKTGYIFVGWNTYANGLGTLRPVGSTYLLNSNVTMYADFVSATVSKNVPSLILKGKIVVTAPPKKIALNQIVPVHQQFLTKLPTNAVGFELYENGKFAISAKSNSVFLKQIVGPKDQVTVVAVGKNGLKSAPSPVALSKDPISLANINFNTDSYKFIGIATKILDKVAAVMIQHGYTHLDIWGYVDTQGSKASWVTLSNNRAKAVNNYMAKKLKGTGIVIKNAGRAQTQAVGNNNTAAGRALNRRVEIRVS